MIANTVVKLSYSAALYCHYEAYRSVIYLRRLLRNIFAKIISHYLDVFLRRNKRRKESAGGEKRYRNIIKTT